MDEIVSVKIREFAKDTHLKLLAGEKGLDRILTKDKIQIPGLEITGCFDYFNHEELVLIGSKENAYLAKKNSKDIVEHIFQMEPPCLVFSKNIEVSKLFYEMADKYSIAVFQSDFSSTQSISILYTYLQEKLTPKLSIHGTLMDINGMGTLIVGKSGIGKSETALDLIKRGHQLVADDLVEIRQKEPGNLIGTAPNILKRYIEIRGIGIVDVVTMFGAGAYQESKNIHLVVELENWDINKNYDRLGIETKKIKYFETEVTKITIPVSAARTASLLIESAAMNEKLKLLGFNVAQDFVNKVAKKAKREEK